MKELRTAVCRVVAACLENGARQAVIYLSPTTVVKASRQFKVDRRNRRTTIVLTVGAPNYSGREFIKLCQKAGEKFPIRKIQLKFYK
jgi:hypothetical protein